jgi:hypothetical protein
MYFLSCHNAHPFVLQGPSRRKVRKQYEPGCVRVSNMNLGPLPVAGGEPASRGSASTPASGIGVAGAASGGCADRSALPFFQKRTLRHMTTGLVLLLL